jgi:hypothetical protein
VANKTKHKRTQKTLIRELSPAQAVSLAHLLVKLDRAFHGDPTQPDLASSPPWEIKRLRYVVALTAVAEFLDPFGAGHQLSRWFADLASAIQDLNKGVTRPLLKAPTKRGNPNVSSNDWRVRAFIALVVEVKMRAARLTREAAAKWICKECPEIKRLVTRQTSKPVWQSVCFWRDQFAEERVSNHEATAVFQAGISNLKNSNLKQLDDFVARALAEVRNCATGILSR